MLRVDAHVQSEERHDDARQRVRRRYHEHDYHLQTRCLVYVGAAQDRTCHHARDGDKAYHAAIHAMSEVRNKSCGLVLPHLVDGWHQGETQRFDRERTTGLKA